jgi:CheY-like chemotaxis protein
MHAGSVEARSAGHGKGSEFVVRLPIVMSPAEHQAAADQPKALSTSGRRIVIADDNRDSARSLARMLELMGSEAHVAYDGHQALEVAAAIRPDVIFLDIGMPNLNGYETARRIRNESWGKNVVLVALTGWGQEQDKRRSQDAGFDLHMVKPIDPATLDALLPSSREK